MEYSHHTLPNGLRVVHLPVSTPVSYCGFAINAGTRDETADEFGLAHFTEHLLFKGTRKRRACHILNRMEVVGGELNAYTTKEDTFVYSIFMEPHFDRAAELLTDIVFGSVYPQHEIEKEIDVVLDEINSYKDNPSELIFDDFENLLFENHALGHHILGDEQSVPRFDTQSVASFTSRTYDPSQMVFFSLGATDFRTIVRRLEALLSTVPGNRGALNREAPTSYRPQQKVLEKETFQSHAILGNRAFSLYEEKERTALYVLNNILGGPGMNSRLNVLLREKMGWVYNVESSFVSFTDTGMFSIYFGCDPKNTDKCLKGVQRELKRLREEQLTSSQLDAAKRQLYGQLGVATDHRENMALGLGKSFLRFNKYDSLEELFARIDTVSASDLLEAANRVFEPDALTTLVYK